MELWAQRDDAYTRQKAEELVSEIVNYQKIKGKFPWNESSLVGKIEEDTSSYNQFPDNMSCVGEEFCRLQGEVSEANNQWLLGLDDTAVWGVGEIDKILATPSELMVFKAQGEEARLWVCFAPKSIKERTEVVQACLEGDEAWTIMLDKKCPNPPYSQLSEWNVEVPELWCVNQKTTVIEKPEGL